MNAIKLAARADIVTSFVSITWAYDQRTVIQFLPRERQIKAMSQSRDGETLACTLLPSDDANWNMLFTLFYTSDSFTRWEMGY